jgi:hypothetical protein
MGPKAKRIFEEVGNGMSDSSREAILSIDRLEREVEELKAVIAGDKESEGEPDAGGKSEPHSGSRGPEDREDREVHVERDQGDGLVSGEPVE